MKLSSSAIKHPEIIGNINSRRNSVASQSVILTPHRIDIVLDDQSDSSDQAVAKPEAHFRER